MKSGWWYEFVREALVGIISGGIASVTALLSVLQETVFEDITTGVWITIAGGGFLAMATGWKAFLSRPPKRFEDDHTHT